MESSFSIYIQEISSSLWLLSQIKSFPSIEDTLLFNNVNIRPHLDYCSVIWRNSTNSNIQKNHKIAKTSLQNYLGSGLYGFTAGAQSSEHTSYRLMKVYF